jgi:predicted transcriptional regulator
MSVQIKNTPSSANSKEGASNLTIRIDRLLREGLEDSARMNDRSLSAEIRQAVRDHLLRQAA